MFGVSFFELILIFVVALVVFGPEKLPEVPRFVGKITGDFQKTSQALRREFYNAVYEPAKEDLTRARTEISQLRSDILATTRLEPSCPDTIAKRNVLMQSSADTLLPTNSASNAAPDLGQAVSPLETPSNEIAATQEVAVSLPYTPSHQSTPGPK